MTTAAESPSETREELGRESEAVRRRLLSHVDELRNRTKTVGDFAQTVKTEAKRHAPLLIGLGAVALLAAGVLAVRARGRRRSRERRDAILYAATRLLGPGYQIRPAQAKPAFVTGLEQLGKQLLTAASRELGNRALAKVGLTMPAHPERETTAPRPSRNSDT